MARRSWKALWLEHTGRQYLSRLWHPVRELCVCVEEARLVLSAGVTVRVVVVTWWGLGSEDIVEDKGLFVCLYVRLRRDGGERVFIGCRCC